MSKPKQDRLSGRRGSRLLDQEGRECADQAWLSKLIIGLSAGLLYVDEDLWHARLLVYHVDAQGRWYIITPDSHISIEDVSCRTQGGADCAFVCAAAGDAPRLSDGVILSLRRVSGQGRHHKVGLGLSHISAGRFRRRGC